MRILCDIGHPAHVHLFKNVLQQLEHKGHEYFVTTRARDMTLELLHRYRIPHIVFGKRYVTIYGKAYGLAKFDYLMVRTAKQFKPDIFLSHGSMYAAHAASLLGRPHISLEDTDNMEQIRLYSPFTACILTSTCFPKKFGKKQIRYEGYHELAYLHPLYFRPNPSVCHKFGLEPGEKFIIMRFVDWKATHDMRHAGISDQYKIIAAKEFSKHARVFISSESALPGELESYRVMVSPDLMHDLLYYAMLFYGESGTMASECAVLGTPAIFLDNNGRLYTTEQEKMYGLVFNLSESLIDQRLSIERGVELLQTPNLKNEFHQRRLKLLRDKIDVSSFLVWFVENYPESMRIMTQEPDYHLRFRTTIGANLCA